MAGHSAAAGGTGHPEIAVALTDGRTLARLGDLARTRPLLEALGLAPPAFMNGLAERRVVRLHLGNEFCERLVPTPTVLRRALDLAEDCGLALTLATPSVPDAGIARLRRLFRLLPGGTEIVVNDYGVLSLAAREFPTLRRVAGRQLCKMIKDPRLPSAQWARLNPPGLAAPGFGGMLQRLGIDRAEVDVPPFAQPADLRAGGLALSVHAPFGYAVRGRVCRIGSLRFADVDKFRPDQACSKECLRYVCRLSRPSDRAGRDLQSFQRGNSIFYRHDAGMERAMWRAVQNGWIDRLVLPADWCDRGLAMAEEVDDAHCRAD